MQLAITDANIFIDLYELDLLESFFQLPYDLHTTVFVLDELETECRQSLTDRISVLNISSEEKAELDKLNWNSGFTFTDKSILFLAKKENMLVLSGEKKMMKWCKTNNIPSHGILFILEEFIRAGLFDSSYMANKLNELMDFNQWLPTEICISLIEKWSK